MTNKFQIGWQIVRTKARKIKNVEEKIEFVKSFLLNNSSKENKARIKNWAIMSRMGYRDQVSKMYYTDLLEFIETVNLCMDDAPNDFSLCDVSDLLLVHKDLTNRKYGFQFKFEGAPKSHVFFMSELTSFLEHIDAI